MNVNNRKLFANRDARRRLSEMGGILSSSPELMGATQRFQTAGRVTPLRGQRTDFIPTTPSAMGGSMAAEALIQDPRIQVAAMQSGMTPAEYVSRLSPEQFSRAISMLSEDMAGTVRDEASFAAADRYDGPGGGYSVEETPSLSAPALSSSGLTGVEPAPTVGSEDIRRMANENLVTPSDRERLAIAGDVVAAPIAAGVEALADPQNQQIAMDAIRSAGSRLGDAYVSGIETLAETPLYTPSAPPSLTGDLLEDFRNYGMEGVNREGATVSEGVNLLEALDAQAQDPTLTEAERDAFEIQRNTLAAALEVGQGIDDAVGDAYALIGRVTGAGIEGAGALTSVMSPELGARVMEAGRAVSESMDPIAEEGFIPGQVGDISGGRDASEPEPAILSPAEAAATEAGGTDSTPEDRQLTAEELADVVSGSEDPNADAASVVLSSLGGGEGTDLSSVEGRISAYEDLFTRMLGESDEEKRREKYMNLAMVGFAIAAGEDPSALKNIADGLLAGTAQMQESAAARREREDRIKELAISLGFEDYQAAIKAAADAAESDAESFFGTDAGKFASGTYSDLIEAGLTHSQSIERMNEASGMGDRFLEAVEMELSPSTPDLTPQQRVRVAQAQQALADQASPEAVAEVLRNEGIDPSVLGL